MGMFYLIVGNVNPRYRSKLICINLLLAVESDLLNTYGMNEILKPIVDELKLFEIGVE